MRRHLPILDDRFLDNLGVAAPCDADWNAMKGDARVRHCPACRQNVYNLSSMSRREAAGLIAEREGKVCIRMLQRSDGTLVTSDCRELLRRARQRGVFAYAVALVLAMAVSVGLRAWGAYALWSWLEERQSPRLMGAMVAPVPITGEPATVPIVEAPRMIKGEMVVRPHPDPRVLMGGPMVPVPRKHQKLMGKPAARPIVVQHCDPNSDPLCCGGID